MTDANELRGFLAGGKLTKYPSKRKKKLVALCWLAEYVSPKAKYTEREFNDLLNGLHTFGDPALLRRELYDYGLVDRNPDGSRYWLNPERPSLEKLLADCCGGTAGTAAGDGDTAEEKTTAECGGGDLRNAADFRNRIHEEALKRARRIRPDIARVVDRYPVEAYFQRVWDYPGAWYTVVAIPESAKSREALIDAIVRDTLANSR